MLFGYTLRLVEMRECVYKTCFILQLILILGKVCGIRVTELNVPPWVDPRDSLSLGCKYDMGGEELYSVKWYKDEQEFFRYTPRQQPHVISFPVAGVHLESEASLECHETSCQVQLARLSTAHSSGAYKCEVSTEAPKFRVGFRSQNVTVAAVGRKAPHIDGLQAVYSLGDLVLVNCTAAPADPAPSLVWKVNDAVVSGLGVGMQRASVPDAQGMVTVWRDLRFHAERRHFPAPEFLVRIVCVAQPPPGVPAEPLVATPAIARLLQPPSPQQRNVLANQKLHWLNGKASIQSFHRGLVFLLVAVCWRFYKFCT